MKTKKRLVLLGLLLLLLALTALWLAPGLRPLPPNLHPVENNHRIRLQDRYGTTLSLSRETSLNTSDSAELDTIPLLLRQAILMAEDQRFFRHRGTDWRAVAHALFQNFKARKNIRGASSITEQVVRILHPRPRTLRSRILESVEAHLLEKKVSKADILTFYLNQVPYPDRSRGVVQAARDLFDRDLSTLSANEILTLAVLPRAPQGLHPERHPQRLEIRVQALALRMVEAGLLEERALAHALKPATLHKPALSVYAPFFIRFVRDHTPTLPPSSHLRTTLDGPLQKKIQALLDSRVDLLRNQGLINGAALVLHHKTGEIRAWAVAGNGDERPGGRINAVLTPRQPGSTLKPFAYALALEAGWTAATILADTPISTPVGRGLHDYQNYSRNTYGALPLRDALANSLNLAAIRTVRHVGTGALLNTLKRCGIQSLNRHPDFYGDGLVLGNGEVSLLELTQAYAVLAQDGRKLPLRFLALPLPSASGTAQIFQTDTARLIAHILSDPEARRREFGPLLSFPVQTAVKTGTSSDHRDLWAMGFDHSHTVGIWMGNLDRSATQGLAGASGPVPLLRAIFAELNRNQPTQGLPPPQTLVLGDVCIQWNAENQCTALRSEWLPPQVSLPSDKEERDQSIRLARPTDGLLLAMDPRIPQEHQRLPLTVEGVREKARYAWLVDGMLFEENDHPETLWPLTPGNHEIQVRIFREGRQPIERKAQIRVMGAPLAFDGKNG